MAEDLHEFWHNLAAGRDCITEIPPERWNWQEYYGDPATEVNKTNKGRARNIVFCSFIRSPPGNAKFVSGY